MPKFSMFTPFQMMRFSSAPSRAESIYRAMYAAQVDAFDMSVGEYQEAKTYARAMGIARSRYALERALNQLDPLKSIEMLNRLEHDWVVIPSVLDELRDRQLAVAARMILAQGSKFVAVQAGLQAILGSHFIALRTLQPIEVTSHLPTVCNYTRVDLPFKVIRFKDPITTTGSLIEVDYENADLTAGPVRMLAGDVLTVQPDNSGELEVVNVVDATSTSFTAFFTKAHDLGCLATTQNWVPWVRTQRVWLIGVDEYAALDTELNRRVNDFMERISKGTSCWHVITPNSPTVGPFTLDESPLGSTTIDLMDLDPGPLPFVGTLQPDVGSFAGGTTIEVFGRYFTDVTEVRVNNQVVSHTLDTNFPDDIIKITFNSPSHVTPIRGSRLDEYVDVQITTDVGVVLKRGGFKYNYSQPFISSVSPDHGFSIGGDTVTIQGLGFLGTTKVFFNDVQVETITPTLDDELEVITPPGVGGLANIRIVNPQYDSGTSGNEKFTYDYSNPIITSVTPTSGPTRGVAGVSIVGTGFTEATGVRVNEVLATNFQLIDDELIICDFPALTDPAKIGVAINVVVFNPVTESSGTHFTYNYDTPFVTLVNPSSGPDEGGVNLSIFGKGFLGATSAKISGIDLTDWYVESDSVIIGVSGDADPTAPGAVNVLVTNPSHNSGTSGNGKFSFV